MADPKQDRRKAQGGAIAGAGGTAAGIGLIGGGIPGFKSNSSTIGNIKQGGWAKRTGAAASSLRGGIFGYRTDAHKGFLRRQQNDEKEHAGKTTSRVNMYHRGVGSGKIGPEQEIIRHMKAGRKASTVALVGGGAAAAYGVHRSKEPVKKAQHRSDSYNAGLAAGGATAAGASYGGAKLFEHQAKKWAGRSAQHLDEAKKIVPNLGGHKVTTSARYAPNPRVPNAIPEKGHKLVANDKKILAGKSKAQAEAAGRLRGAADQGAYFSGVYGKTAKLARKVPRVGLTVAGVGAGGLLASRGASAAKEHHKKKQISKRMSAFGVEH